MFVEYRDAINKLVKSEADGVWNENLHPRDRDGRWTAITGASIGVGAATAAVIAAYLNRKRLSGIIKEFASSISTAKTTVEPWRVDIKSEIEKNPLSLVNYKPADEAINKVKSTGVLDFSKYDFGTKDFNSFK